MSEDTLEFPSPRAKQNTEPEITWAGGMRDEELQHIDAHGWEVVNGKATAADHQTTAIHLIGACRALRNARQEIVRLRRERDRAKERAEAADRRLAAVRKAGTLPECFREFQGKLVECVVPSHNWPCIYFLMCGDVVVYIGKSESLGQRLAHHVVDGKQFDRALAMRVPMAKLDETERAMIARFLPRLNTNAIPLAELRRRRAATET